MVCIKDHISKALSKKPMFQYQSSNPLRIIKAAKYILKREVEHLF